MWSTSANFNTENAKNTKRPCVIIKFEEQDTGPTDIKYCSADFSNRDPSYYKLYVKQFTYNSQKWEPREVIMQNKSSFTVTLVDINNEITALLYNNKICRKKITCEIGFTAITEGSFYTLEDYIVTKITIDSKMLEYKFLCEQNDESVKLYNTKINRTPAKTQLSGDHTWNTTTFNVDSTTYFTDPTSIEDGLKNAAFKVDDEIITYTGWTGTSFTTCTRGAFGTDAVPHNDDAAITQIFALGETVGQIFLRLATSKTGSNGKYDMNIAGLGAQIDSSFFDMEQIERESWKFQSYYSKLSCYNEESVYIVEENILLKDAVEKLFAPFHIVLYYTNDSTYYIKALDLPFMEADASAETMNHDNSKIMSMENADQKMITSIEYKDEYNPLKNTFDRQETLTNDTSETAYGSYPTFTIENVGYHENEVTYKDKYCGRDRYFLFYGNMYYNAKVISMMKKVLFEPFDTVLLTHNKYPNFSDGSRVWSNQICLIKSKRFMLTDGKFESQYDALIFDLSNKATGLYSWKKYLDSVESFDDTGLTYNSNWTVTVNAEDAYWRWSDTRFDYYKYYYACITITPPNSGSAAEQWIEIGIMVYNHTFGDVLGCNKVKIRYNSGWSDNFDIWLFCDVGPRSLVKQPTTIKLDYMARSTSTAGQLPSSITFKEVRGIKRDFTVS